MTVLRDPEGVETRYLCEVARPEEAHVLEVGCGDGRLTWRYAGTTCRTIAFDPDLERLAAAQAARPPELADRVCFLQADAEHLPLRPGSFDLAILAWSL